MAEFLTGFSNILWGAPVLILLGIVGLLYGIRTKFFQIRKMGYILKNTAGEMFKKGGGASGDRGTLTPLQAVCSALAGCVGTANIAGVATAMVIGGPGAVFWMWVIALLGMMTKCVEVTLGQYYRIQGKDGVYYGGPMYYIERGMGKKWKPLAIFFAVTIILGGLGTAAFAQPYTMSTALERTFHIPAWVVTVAAAAICGIVLIGGVKGIEFGGGFSAVSGYGSDFNDAFRMEQGRVVTATNRNGGINGGITNGMDVVFQCAVKPTPSIGQPQQTVDFLRGEDAELTIHGRHDPAIIRRICPVLDSVTALVLCDLLTQRFGTDYLTKEGRP